MLSECRDNALSSGAAFWIGLGVTAVGLGTAIFALPQVVSAERVEPSALAAQASAQTPVTVDEQTRLRQSNEQRYSDGAIVVTRPELEDLLRRAEAFAKDNSYRNAVVLWSRVLEEGGSSLTSTDAETYVPLVDRVEEAIGQLPAEGLAAYRIIADGEATALLAQSQQLGRDVALGSVVERHFMSSLGDQAAFELAGRMLDRFDFISSTRLLEKIVTRHPDPDVPAGELHLRRAVSWISLGDARQAKAALELAVTARPAVEPELLEAVSRYINTNVDSQTRLDASFGWGMPFGNSRRDGVMPGLPAEYFAGDLMVADTAELDSVVSAEPVLRVTRMFNNQSTEPATPLTDALNRASTNRWLPAQRAVLGPDGILVKGSRTPYYFRADESGKIQKGWESLWHNMYMIDDATVAERVNLMMYGAQPGTSSAPTHVTEVFLFADSIHQSMAVVGEVAFVVEGQPFARGRDFPSANQANNGFFGPQAIRRSRTNWLTAYHVRSGRLLWTRAARDVLLPGGQDAEIGGFSVPELAPDPSAPPAVEEPAAAQVAPGGIAVPADPNAPAFRDEGDGLGPDGLPLIPERGNVTMVSNGVGYMGSPVIAGGLLVLPVSDAGSMHLQALNPQTGETIWRTPLCDAPTNGAPNFAAVNVAVDGQDIYVTCGMGLLFSINASDGRVRFARRYDRDPLVRQTNPNMGMGNQMPQSPKFRGWSEDVVLPFQGVVIVAASDSDRLVAFDRTNGSFVWTAPRNPFSDEMEYLVGVRGRYLYTAGRQSILCYDMQGQGKLVWREEFSAESLGRACMTETGIFVPVSGSIAHYSFDVVPGTRSRKVTQVGVRGLGERTVGNLYSDGRRLWSLAAGRLMLLEPADRQIESLEDRSEAGDPRATWERAMLAVETGQPTVAESLAKESLAQWELASRPASESPFSMIDFEQEFRSIRNLEFVELADSDPSRIESVLRVLAVVASHQIQGESAVDPVALGRHRSKIVRMVDSVAGEWNPDQALGWGELLWSLPSWSERLQFAASLSPGRSARDSAMNLMGASDPGRIFLGLAWLDASGLQQASDRLLDLTRSEQYPESIRCAALERLIQARSAQSPELLANAIGQWSNAYARLRVIRCFERATGEQIAIDPLASAPQRLDWANAWLAQLRSRPEALSWREVQIQPTERFDRMLVGFPNTGLVAEVSAQGEILREEICERMIAVAADELGNRWVAYPDRLQCRSCEGTVLFDEALEAYPKGLVVREGGEVWVALDGLPGNLMVFRSGEGMELIETSGEAVDALAVWDSESCLVALRVSGRLERWSRDGQDREPLPLSFISGVTRLDNGNVLATSSLNGSVHELDAMLRPVMRRSQLPQARAAARTQAGLTVVAFSQGLVALDRDAQEAWSIREHGPAITLAYF